VLFNSSVEIGDRFVEVFHVRHDVLQQEAVVISEPAGQRGAEFLSLPAEPSPGHCGEHTSVALTGYERLYHLAARDTQHLGRNVSELDVCRLELSIPKTPSTCIEYSALLGGRLYPGGLLAASAPRRSW
jgi:hypothetical protein